MDHCLGEGGVGVVCSASVQELAQDAGAAPTQDVDEDERAGHAAGERRKGRDQEQEQACTAGTARLCWTGA